VIIAAAVCSIVRRSIYFLLEVSSFASRARRRDQ
jgi:hypothetical protein